MKALNTKSVVCSIIITTLIISMLGCSVSRLESTKPNVSVIDKKLVPAKSKAVNKNFVEAERLLVSLSKKNLLLATELGKLPELQDGISVKEVEALKNILQLYEIAPIVFNNAFSKMYKEGNPEIRKFCSPLQALFWLSEKVEFSQKNNPLADYELENLLNKAWGLYGCVLSTEEVNEILYGRVYQGDKQEINFILSKLRKDPSIFRDEAFKDEVRNRWTNFDQVTDRLNSPKLVFKYVKANIFFPMAVRGKSPRSPWQTFKSRKGNCAYQALFVDYCLKKAGYDSVVIRYDCTAEFCGPKRGRLSYTNPTPYHWTVAYKDSGAIFELDAGRHYMGGPYKTYSEIAGGNRFIFKSWFDYK